MNKIRLMLFLFLVFTACIYSQEQKDYLRMINDLYTVAQQYKANNLPNEFTITYNYYILLEKKITDKKKIVVIDSFFTNTKNAYRDSFRDLLISMYFDPKYPDNVTSSVTSISRIIEGAFLRGYDMSDFILKDIGPIDDIDINKLPKKN